MVAGLAKKLWLLLLIWVVIGVTGFRFATKHSENYFPLEAGISLEYDFKRTKGELQEKGKVTVTNLAARKLQDKMVVPRKYDMKKEQGGNQAYLAFFYNDKEGVQFFAVQAEKESDPKLMSPPFYYIKNPLETGTTWGSGDSPRGRIESVSESITVPAGTFKNCVKVNLTFPQTMPMQEATFWFAERIGIIKSIYRYKDAREEQFQLTAIKEKGN